MKSILAFLAIIGGLLSLPALMRGVDDLGCWWVRRQRHARIDRNRARIFHNLVAYAIRQEGLHALPAGPALALQEALRDAVLRAETIHVSI